jgi:hypothetical protein
LAQNSRKNKRTEKQDDLHRLIEEQDNPIVSMQIQNPKTIIYSDSCGAEKQTTKSQNLQCFVGVDNVKKIIDIFIDLNL